MVQGRSSLAEALISLQASRTESFGFYVVPLYYIHRSNTVEKRTVYGLPSVKGNVHAHIDRFARPSRDFRVVLCHRSFSISLGILCADW